MSLIISKITIIPFLVLHIIGNPIIRRNHSCCKLISAVNCRLTIRIGNSKKLIHLRLYERSFSSLISILQIGYSSLKSALDFDVNSLVETFHYNIKNICEVYSAIKELFKSNLSSSTESTCRNFIVLTIKLKYFVNTCKTNLGNKLLCASPCRSSNLLYKNRTITLIKYLGLCKLSVLSKNLCRKNIINYFFHKLKYSIFILTELSISTCQFIHFISKCVIQISVAKLFIPKGISTSRRRICFCNSFS